MKGPPMRNIPMPRTEEGDRFRRMLAETFSVQPVHWPDDAYRELLLRILAQQRVAGKL